MPEKLTRESTGRFRVARYFVEKLLPTDPPNTVRVQKLKILWENETLLNLPKFSFGVDNSPIGFSVTDQLEVNRFDNWEKIPDTEANELIK